MNKTALKDLFYQLWFPRRTQDITIIAPPSFDDLEDAELTSTNYALMDKVGDRDSVYWMGKLLSRRYPESSINLICSDDFAGHGVRKNFVILGGPGGSRLSTDGQDVESVEGNEACRLFMRRVQSSIGYTPDCEGMQIGSKEVRAAFDRNRHMVKDYGVFSAFSNPFNRSARIVLLHGIHTLGVLGAVRAFDGDSDSETNFDRLLAFAGSREGISQTAFECWFEVNVLRGDVECPIVDAANLRGLEVRIDHSAERAGGTSKIAALLESPSDDLFRIIDLVKIAEASAIDSKRRSLERLRVHLQAVPAEDLALVSKLSGVAKTNERFPEESIRNMIGLIENATMPPRSKP